MLDRQNLRDFDWLMFAAVIGLAIIGVAFIWSATTGQAHAGNLARTQAQWLIISLVAFAAIIFFDYLFFYNNAYIFYGIGLALLLALPIFGTAHGGAKRWIHIGPYMLQPSELMKVAVIIMLAHYLSFRRNYRELRGLPLPFVLVFLPMVLIIRQPDLGTGMVLLPAMLVMLYVAGAKLKHLALAIGGGVVAAPIMWMTVLNDYQKDRVLTFIIPHSDKSGAGYQSLQSIIAISFGGFFGEGYAQGTQHLLDRLPAAETDFIFAVIAEDWGFVGATLVIALFFIFFMRGLAIAAKTREPFGRLLVIGGLTIFAFQVCVNIGMTIRLCPVTGVTLPFISYGGSSLLSSFLIFGLIMSVGMRRKSVVAPDDFT